ncbi:type II CRISPR RNA-guided endonuclease Cas9 [uncultured Algibacter sp.]|uniref:type II CRISPR RNA-guided endonuclease Cas9 n=1 Tax=uncultured Algibacter sp. TaxID=298659 RepID=UPI00260CC18F|nr:type II CRISPR RNA-guided endonuclease Cas9 [uncultured Algibacter sp.]
MTKILGLDLGTNSIGWALINEKENNILGIGSRIFPEGVVNLGEGEGREASKNASRTDARGTRRQFYRRRLRKRYLLRELAKKGLCPIEYSVVKIWNQKEIFSNHDLQEWLKLNPYQLRAKAIKEQISLVELGRIFYHMIQRRGFQSNSRSAGADNNEKSVIFKGDTKIGKIGISETAESIKDSQTLGAFLNTIYPKENEPYTGDLKRIRNRYTTRQMYVDEFETIWETQKQFHPELTKELKTILGGRKKDGYSEDGVLFHQRPLRSQKHLVGHCTFEPKKTKCPVSAIPNEERRIYEWVNTLKCDLSGEKVVITQDEREKILKFLFSKEKIKFKEVRKTIGKLDGHFQFNYKDDDKILGSHTISNLSNKKFFGDKWFDFSEKEKEDIWHVLYNFDDRDRLKQYAIEKWGFSEEKADRISKFNLKDGYANLSRKAINNILPFLKMGFMNDVSVGLGGVRNALGDTWHTNKQFMLDNVPEIVRSNLKGGYIKPLKEMLKAECRLSDKELLKLYHHSSAIETSMLLDRLPVNPIADKEIQGIKNPVVITALFEIRKLVNEIIDDYGKPDEIKVELARDLKSSKKNRYETRRKQQFLEKQNDRVKAELDYIGQRPTHLNLLKYKLWEECNKTCPYTGKNIEVNQLFSGEVQIEHIYPWSRSLNDSFMNKTLCFADENRAKDDLTPYEFYSKQGEEKWQAIKLQALSCFKNKANYPNAYNKFKQFVKKKQDDDFISRQLNDTRYISKEAKNYLSKICGKVMVAPGQMTSKLRHHWGLNTILNQEKDAKSRDDHRHHAIDALVMACATRSHLQELSKWNRYDRNYALHQFPMPWESFREDAEIAIEQILVSHKKSKSILTVRTHTTKKQGKTYKNIGVAARGQLHHQTVYGSNKNCNTDEYVYRVAINSLSFLQLNNIIDLKLKEVIVDNILKSFDYDEKDFFLKMISKEKNLDKQNQKIIKGKVDRYLKENKFFMPNEGKRYKKLNKKEPSGIKREPIPIYKVRVKKVLGRAERLKDNIKQYVDPQKNHHVLIYKDEKGNLKEDVVTFWTVVERKRKGFPVYQLPADGKEIVTTLHINDMFLLGLNEDEIDWENPNKNVLKDYIYRVQKLTSGDYFFRKHTSSTVTDDKYKQVRGFGEGKTGWFTFNPIKVKISVTGKIEKI